MLEILIISTTSAFAFISWISLLFGIVCFFMSRNDEKRSGRNTMSGKSAVIFTLMNQTAWTTFFGFSLMLITLVLPEKQEWNEDDLRFVDAGMDWMPFRIGFILAFTGAVSTLCLGLTWKSLSKTGSSLPSWNMFVKNYSGLNTYFMASITLTLGTIILMAIGELVVNENIVWEGQMDTPIKVCIMLLMTSTAFLVVNLLIYSKTSDRVIPFVKAPEKQEI